MGLPLLVDVQAEDDQEAGDENNMMAGTAQAASSIRMMCGCYVGYGVVGLCGTVDYIAGRSGKNRASRPYRGAVAWLPAASSIHASNRPMTLSAFADIPSRRGRAIRWIPPVPCQTCILVLALLLAALPAFAGGTQGSKAAKPRYTMPSGRGWGVCEAYLKFLNSTPADEEPPMCDLKLGRVPGMKEPDWEVLDIEQHLEYVHQMELIIGKFEIEPEPEKDFALWQVQRKERINKRDQKPRLRRAKVALVQGGPVETVLAYDFDAARCLGELKKAKRGVVYDVGAPNRPHFFILDTNRQKILGTWDWPIRTLGEVWLYKEASYYMNLSVMDQVGERGVSVYVKRIQPILQTRSPDEPPYISQELCRIRFDYPFPPFAVK